MIRHKAFRPRLRATRLPHPALHKSSGLQRPDVVRGHSGAHIGESMLEVLAVHRPIILIIGDGWPNKRECRDDNKRSQAGPTTHRAPQKINLCRIC